MTPFRILVTLLAICNFCEVLDSYRCMRIRGIFFFILANWKYRTDATRRIVANDLRCQKESLRHFLICGSPLPLSSFARAPPRIRYALSMSMRLKFDAN